MAGVPLRGGQPPVSTAGESSPPWAGLVAGRERVTPVVEGEAVTQRLTATYFDSRGHRLARAHLTLRRQTGGRDAGWHLLVPGAGSARQEVRLPLGRAIVTVPAALRKMVWALTRGEPLAPVATIVTERTVQDLVDETGQVLVEVADDRARAARLSGTASGDGQVSTWREIQVELRGVDRGWLDAVDVGLRDLGLSVADARSELARVLADGDGAPASSAQHEPKPKRPSPKSPAGDVVLGYVNQQSSRSWRTTHRSASTPRAASTGCGWPPAGCAARCRPSSRSWTPRWSRPLRAELQWLAGELGAARDAEVLRDRMTAALQHEDRQVHLGPLGDTVDTDLTQAYRAAHDELLKALDSERYHQLVAEPRPARDRTAVRARQGGPTSGQGAAPAGRPRVRPAARAWSTARPRRTRPPPSATPPARGPQGRQEGPIRRRDDDRVLRQAGRPVRQRHGEPAGGAGRAPGQRRDARPAGGAGTPGDRSPPPRSPTAACTPTRSSGASRRRPLRDRLAPGPQEVPPLLDELTRDRQAGTDSGLLNTSGKAPPRKQSGGHAVVLALVGAESNPRESRGRRLDVRLRGIQ